MRLHSTSRHYQSGDSLAWQSSETTWLPYDRLTAYDLNLNPQPMLAESWDLSSDATGIKLNIRKHVQFHSGRELTSDDVKYSILRVRDPGVGAGQFTNQSNWFTLSIPRINTAWCCDPINRDPACSISSSTSTSWTRTLSKVRMPKPHRSALAPFKFVEWSAGDHFTLARNDSYWQAGRPLLDGVEARFFRDTQAMTVQLEAGAIDAMTLPLRQDLDKARTLLSQAGVTSLTTDLLPVPGQPFAENYQADLAKTGITVNIVNMDIAAWVDQANNRKYHSLYFASNSTPGAQLSPPTLFNAKPLDPNNNNSAFKSDAYSQLVTAAAAEADPTRSKQLISQLNDMVLDESLSIPLSPTLLTKVARTAVHDITPNMHTGWMFADTWIDA